MSTTMKQTIESIKGISDEEPLKDVLPFVIPRDKLAVTDEFSSISPTLPSTMLLGALRDPRLRLLAPLTITFERENNDIVAYCEELEEFGFGTHLTEAIQDLQVTITELYFTLKEDSSGLGSHLTRVWNSLSQKIKEVA